MLWGALRACYGTESEAVAAAARNTGTILPYLNSPSNIKGCYAVLVELLGREQAAEVCAKNPGILQCNPRVLAPERGTQSPARPRLERRRPRPWPSGDAGGAGPWRRAAPSVPLGACRALCAQGRPPPPVGGECGGPGPPASAPRSPRRGRPPSLLPRRGSSPTRWCALPRRLACPCRDDVASLRAAGCPGGPPGPGPALGG